jgi:hypothetical protein
MCQIVINSNKHIGKFLSITNESILHNNVIDVLYLAQYMKDKTDIDSIRKSAHYKNKIEKWKKLLPNNYIRSLDIHEIAKKLKINIIVHNSRGSYSKNNNFVSSHTNVRHIMYLKENMYKPMVLVKGGAKNAELLQVNTQNVMPYRTNTVLRHKTQPNALTNRRRRPEEPDLVSVSNNLNREVTYSVTQPVLVPVKSKIKNDIAYYCRDYPLLEKQLLTKVNKSTDLKVDKIEIYDNMINHYMGNIVYGKKDDLKNLFKIKINKLQLQNDNLDKKILLNELIQKRNQRGGGIFNKKTKRTVLAFSNTNTCFHTSIMIHDKYLEENASMNRLILMDFLETEITRDKKNINVLHIITASFNQKRIESDKEELDVLYGAMNDSTHNVNIYFSQGPERQVKVIPLHLADALNIDEIRSSQELSDYMFKQNSNQTPLHICRTVNDLESICKEFPIDIIYFNGGETHLLKQRIETFDFKRVIDQYNPNAILSGFSAGIINCGHSTHLTGSKATHDHYNDKLYDTLTVNHKCVYSVEKATAKYMNSVSDKDCLIETRGLTHDQPEMPIIFPHFTPKMNENIIMPYFQNNVEDIHDKSKILKLVDSQFAILYKSGKKVVFPTTSPEVIFRILNKYPFYIHPELIPFISKHKKKNITINHSNIYDIHCSIEEHYRILQNTHLDNEENLLFYQSMIDDDEQDSDTEYRQVRLEELTKTVEKSVESLLVFKKFKELLSDILLHCKNTDFM